MTAPRRIVPGTTYFDHTGRCTQRQFLLRPSEEINQLLLYCLIYSALKNDMRAGMLTFSQSNHYHLVITDTNGQLPRFQAWLNRVIACVLNARYDRQENLWAPGSYSAVVLRGSGWGDTGIDDTGHEDVMDKIVYTLANPVAAGLVDRAFKWPGLWSAPILMAGHTLEAKRPSSFSQEMPAKVKITLCPPPGFKHLSPKAFANIIALRLVQAENAIHAERKGRPFPGQRQGPRPITSDDPPFPSPG